MTLSGSLYPSRKKPYYFVTPRYVRTSAGIRAIHLLVHWLNRLGEEAYVCISPHYEGELVRPDFLTPLLTPHVVRRHSDEGRNPIVVYTETASENFLNATQIVRFFGHKPNHISKLIRFSDFELDFSYSIEVASETSFPENVLFIPTIDTSIFYPIEDGKPRKGFCYYAAKYKNVHGSEVFGLPNNCFEIVRDAPNQLNQYELADLFRSSELLYCFEDSAIANEAALCGCPVVLMPNAYFEKPIAIDEVGWDGYAWGNSAEEVERARKSVHRVFKNYTRNNKRFIRQVKEFVHKSQSYFNELGFAQRIVLDLSKVSTYNYQPLLDKPTAPERKSNSMKNLVLNVPVIGKKIRALNELLLEERLLSAQLRQEKDDLAADLANLQTQLNDSRLKISELEVDNDKKDSQLAELRDANDFVNSKLSEANVEMRLLADTLEASSSLAGEKFALLSGLLSETAKAAIWNAGRNVSAGYARGYGIQSGILIPEIRADKIFMNAYEAARKYSVVAEHSLMNIYLLIRFFLKTGSIIEFGSYKGGSALFMAIIAKHYRPDVHVYALDTFEGMPETGELDMHQKGDFSDTSLDIFQEEIRVRKLSNLTPIKGLFVEGVKQLPSDIKIAMAHIDCDIYEPAVFTSNWALERLDGYIVFDDPLYSTCIGAMQAAEEVCVQRYGLLAEQSYPHLVYRLNQR